MIGDHQTQANFAPTLIGARPAQRGKLAGVTTAGIRKRKQRGSQSSRVARRPVSAEQPAAGLRAARFRLAGDDYVVLSYPQTEVAAPAALTSSERAIFSALLRGQSNLQIAVSRDRSVRTVANQVAAIFQKLGVGSRAELFARYSGR